MAYRDSRWWDQAMASRGPFKDEATDRSRFPDNERRSAFRLFLDQLGLRTFKRHEARHPERSAKYH